jgi:hypothetical protein
MKSEMWKEYKRKRKNTNHAAAVQSQSARRTDELENKIRLFGAISGLPLFSLE